MRGSPAPDARLVRVTPGTNSPESIPLTGDGLSLVSDPAGTLSVSDGDTSNFEIFQISGAWGFRALADDVPVIVNKKQMTISFLKAGDDLDFDGTHYIFQWASEPVTTETSSEPPAAEQTSGALKAGPERVIKRFELEMAILILELVIILAAALVLALV